MTFILHFMFLFSSVCIQQISFDIKNDLYCNKTEFQAISLDAQKNNNSFLIYDLMDNVTCQTQNCYLVDLLNLTNSTLQSQIKQLSQVNVSLQYNFRIVAKEQQCNIDQLLVFNNGNQINSNINTFIKVNVFSDHQINVNISQGITFNNLTDIFVTNLILSTNSSWVMIQNNNNGIMNTNENTFLLDQISLIGNIHFLLISIQNFLLNNVQIMNSNSPQQQVDIFTLQEYSLPIDYLSFNISIYNLSIQQSTFFNINLLQFPRLQDIVNNISIIIDLITITKTIFNNCFIFSDIFTSTQTPTLNQWVIQNIYIYNSSLLGGSCIAYFQSAMSFRASNWSISQLVASQQTLLFASNTIDMSNVKISNSSFSQSAILNSFNTATLNFQTCFLVNYYNISNITFEYLSCDMKNCLIYFGSPLGASQYIQYVSISNITVKGMTYTVYHIFMKGKQFQRCLINIYGHDLFQIYIKFNYLRLLLNRQLRSNPDECQWYNIYFTIKAINSGNFIDINCLGAQLKQLYTFSDDANSSLSKYQNHIFDCYCISVQDFSDKITFTNLLVEKNYALNQPIILIQGYDSNIKETNETIIFNNTVVQQNNLEITSAFPPSSIIKIDSSQKSSILIENSQFIGNHMHFIVQDARLSVTNFYINSVLGDVTIKNVTFQDNRATASSYGSIYIIAINVQVINCLFRQMNQQNSTWKSQYSQTALNTKFIIQCQGGHAFFESQTLFIENTQFLTSHSLQGAIVVRTINPASIVIQNSQFQNGLSDLRQGVNSKGGCVFIDAQQSNTNVSFNNVSMQSCISRSQGGCIYMASTQYQQSVTVNNSIFVDCLSITGSVFQGDFQQTALNQITMNNIQAYIDNQRQQAFFQDIGQLQVYEWEQLLTKSYLFSLNYVDLTLSNSSFHGSQFQGVLLLQSMINVNIQQARFSSISLYYTPIISISFIVDSNFSMNNIIFLQIKSKDLVELQQICLIKPLLVQDKKILNNMVVNEQQQFFDQELPLMSNYSNLNVADCDLWFHYQNQSIIVQDLRLVKIVIIQNMHSIQLIDFNIFNVNCSDCNSGLISIVAYQPPIDSSRIDSMSCMNTILGTFGCLAITSHNQFEDIKVSSNRMLQQIHNFGQFQRDRLLINNSIFQFSQAQFGAGISMIDVEVMLLACIFNHNIAKQGGGIYFSASQSNSQILVINSTFSNNIAEYAGAAYIQDAQFGQVDKQNDTFINNTATEYGTNLIESPCKIAVSLDRGQTLLKTQRTTDNTYLVIDQVQTEQILYFPSGQKIVDYSLYNQSNDINVLNLTLRVINLNSFDEPQLHLSNYTCTIQSRQSTQFNFTSENMMNNVQNWDNTTKAFNFDQLIISFDPDSNQDQYLELKIICDSIKVPIFDDHFPFSIIGNIQNYYLLMQVRTFSCQQGEYINKHQCTQCESDLKQYQVKKQAMYCAIQDEFTINNITEAKLELKKENWRPNFQTDLIESCYNFPPNCLGGWSVGDESCAEGHVGALCETCDLKGTRNGQKYQKNHQFTCGKCTPNVTKFFVIFASTLFIFIIIVVSIMFTHKSVEIYHKSKIFFKMGIRFKENKQSGVLIKILTNYLQIISTITTFRLQLPINLVDSLNTFSNPVSSTTYSIDCLMVSITHIPLMYYRVIWSMILPIFYLLVILLIYLLGIQIKIFPKNQTIVYAAVLSMFLFNHPILVGAFISLASYRKLSGIDWVQADVSHQFNSTSHGYWLLEFVLPGLILWAIVIPLVIFYFVWVNKNKLDDILVRQRWGFLYNEFRKESYFWEFVKILQKELIIIFLEYYQDSITIKAILVFLTVFFYSQLAKRYQPYLSKQLNSLDQFSASICQMSVLLGALIYQCQNTLNDQKLLWPAYFIIIIGNVLFGFFILRMILYSISEQYVVPSLFYKVIN